MQLSPKSEEILLFNADFHVCKTRGLLRTVFHYIIKTFYHSNRSTLYFSDFFIFPSKHRIKKLDAVMLGNSYSYSDILQATGANLTK
jgi:hypothetical protein